MEQQVLNIIGVTAVDGMPHYIDSSLPHTPSQDTEVMHEDDYSDDNDDVHSNDDDKYFELLHILVAILAQIAVFIVNRRLLWKRS